MHNLSDDVTKEPLIDHFETVVAGAGGLLKPKMAEQQTAVVAFSKDAAKTADVFVHLYPWTAIGFAAAVGVVVGLFSRR